MDRRGPCSDLPRDRPRRARYFSTLTGLGTPPDITLQEIRIESFFPADEATEEASRRLVERVGRS